MSSPTIIRHAQTEGVAAIVVTYFEKRGAPLAEFTATFQTYDVGLPNDRTVITSSSSWDTEQDAIKLFDEWRAAEIGDMPGNL